MYRKYIKRLLDIIISFCALVILSPILLIVAILVRIKLGSPVIFCQERPGKDEKIFKLYKFRSMSNKKDENGNLLPDEQRLTKFGKILRATSLDELPELFNILKGDMSLVGPRPLAVVYLPYYNEKEKHRHDVKPGLTGLAQVNGRNALNWEERFEYDIEYVNNISFINDIKILLKTIYKVFKRDGVVTRGTGKTIDFHKYRKYNVIKLEKENLIIAEKFFKEVKFHMAKTALQGYMGEVYVDNLDNPTFAFAMFGKFLYVDGNPYSEFAEIALKKINDFRIIIANENWFELIENVFQNNIEIGTRYSIKKDTKFDKEKLNYYIDKLDKKYIIKQIDKVLYEKIQSTDSFVTNLKMSENYEKYGIGFCALNEKDEIVGIVTSNAVYDNSVEINIKVAEKERRKGIATAISSKMILECLEKNIYPSWDAANMNSVSLSQKLGYEFDSEYRIYKVNKDY